VTSNDGRATRDVQAKGNKVRWVHGHNTRRRAWTREALLRFVPRGLQKEAKASYLEVRRMFRSYSCWNAWKTEEAVQVL